MKDTDYILIYTIIPTVVGVFLVGYLHFYFLPQYLIDFVQSFFDRKTLTFFTKDYKIDVDTGRPYVSLTIDDSPTQNTPAILDVLKKYNVKATFFIISSFVPGKEEILDRIINEGHEIANHLKYDEASWKLSNSVFETQLVEWEETLRPWIEKKKQKQDESKQVKWFRPGHALFGPSMLKCLKKYNYRIALTNVFPNDANGWNKLQSNNPSLNSWYLKNRTRPGAIIVIHDRIWTIPTLEKCLPILTEKFVIQTLSECLFI